MGALAILLEREAIIATALLGALLATAASLPIARSRLGVASSGRVAVAGYALTGVSMLLMIAAGFLSGR